MEFSFDEFKKYLFSLYKRRYLFISLSLFISIIIIVASFFMPKLYEARSTIFIERGMIDNLMRGITYSPSMGDRIRVLRYYIVSRDLISRVLKDLDADVVAGSSAKFEETIRSYQNKTRISIKGSDVFFVSIQDKDPVFATKYINKLVQKYVLESVASKRKETVGATRFLNEQLLYFKEKIDTLENQINAVRRQKRIYVPVDESSIIVKIGKYNEALAQLKARKNELKTTIKSINGQLVGDEPLMATNLTLVDSGGGASGGENPKIRELQAAVEQLLVTYTESYPSVVKLRGEIAALKAQPYQGSTSLESEQPGQENSSAGSDPVYVDLKMKLYAVQTELQVLETNERLVLQKINVAENELREVPEDRKIILNLERERDNFQQTYSKLAERAGRSELSTQMEIADKTATFRVVDPAVVPNKPAGPKRIMIMIFGLVAGFAGGVAGVVFREKFDNTFKNSDSLRSLGLVVLAEVPRMYSEILAKQIKQKDRVVYACATMGLLFISSLIAHELFHLQIIDQVIIDNRIDKMVFKILDLVR